MISFFVTAAIWSTLALAPVCSPARTRSSHRPDTTSYFVARATRDSVLVGMFELGAHGLTETNTPRPGRSRAVYGQVAIVSQRGRGGPEPPDAGRKVLLIWWTFDAGCDRYFPGSALKLPPDSDVFISLPARPRAEWVDGIPTFDASTIYLGRHEIYSPLLEPRVIYYSDRGPVAIDPISVADYLRVYEALPFKSAVNLDYKGALRGFLRWVEKNAGLATRYPVATLVEQAKVNSQR